LPDDREYYRDRAGAARLMAEAASDETVAKIHRELAENYEKLAELQYDEAPKLRVVAN